VSPVPEQPTIDIKVNLAAAQRYGLKPGDVRRDATTLTSGLIVGNLYEQSKIFDVVVWGAPSVRSNLTELGNLLIDTPSGGQVALKDVAALTVRPEPAAITHDDAVRSVEVAAQVTGDPAAVVSAVRARLARVPMPYEYHAEVFGNATAQHADGTRALAYGAVALVGVFLLLQAAVVSWRRAGLMLASLPLSVAGGVLTAPIAGGVGSTGSLAGLLAVAALALRASVLLGRRIRAGEAAGAADGRIAVVATAARERALPLVLSVLATAAVLLPTAIAGTQAGLEFLHPLAVTMLGGLVSLILVQAFLLPAFLLATVHRKREAAPERHVTPGQPGARSAPAVTG
jgi:Cu/Ag efflux pump CusA